VGWESKIRKSHEAGAIRQEGNAGKVVSNGEIVDF